MLTKRFRNFLQVTLHTAFLRFLLVGTLNTAFAYASFAALVFFGFAPQVALICSTVLGIVFSYATSSRMVFRKSRDVNGFLRFIVVYATAYAFNAASLEVLIQSLKMTPYLAQVLLISPCAILTFWLMGIWVFKAR